MLVLRRPCASVAGLEAEEWADAHRWLQRTCAAVDRLFSPDLYNHCFLMNQDRQVHLHLVPRYAGPREWEGETFDDPHWGTLFGREQRLLRDAQLARLAAQVGAELPLPAP